MKAAVYHLQLNVGDPAVSLPFYRQLLGYLEYRAVHDEGGVAGFTNGTTDLWLIATAERFAPDGFHRKRTGLNHLAFRVPRREDVDRFREEFLRPRAIPELYGTPREFPEYRPGYYAVFFEDPDRLKLEVAHVPGPGAA
ncbi:MAG: VOC family protein [Candidatus Rokubacteria bacterium]|nr:VOC family protein [Candidatus Rokubacteria bacterium]